MKGVQRCGLAHLCPVCSTRIRIGRAAELAEAVRHHQAAGGGVAFLTLTVPHTRADRLSELLDGLPLAFRRVLSGREAVRMRERFAWGSVRVLELTHGENGWHAHYHAALFLSAPLTADDESELREWWHGRWADACTRQGLRRPSKEHGVRLEAVGGDGGAVATYLSKVGRAAEMGLAAEVARGDAKQGRGSLALWQLAALAVEGDRDARALWAEYEQAIKGRRLFSWSKGLRARLTLGEEADDDTLAAERPDFAALDDDPPRLVARIASWQLVQLGRQGRIADLLAAAINGSVAVAAVLNDFCVEP